MAVAAAVVVAVAQQMVLGDDLSARGPSMLSWQMHSFNAPCSCVFGSASCLGRSLGAVEVDG